MELWVKKMVKPIFMEIWEVSKQVLRLFLALKTPFFFILLLDELSMNSRQSFIFYGSRGPVT